MAVFVRERSIVGIEGSGGGFVGCGFAVTPRHILTCAHVVNAALGRTGDAAKPWPETELTIRFPYTEHAPSLRVKVVYWQPPEYDVKKLPSANSGIIEEDIAGLELLDSWSNIESTQLADAIAQAQFKVFGYPKKTSQGAIAEGKIQDKLPLGWFQIDGTCPEGLWAEPGYSGSAVWENPNGDVCYGMVVAAKTRDDGSKTAYMIPAQKLAPAIATLQLLNALALPSQAPDTRWKIYQATFQGICAMLSWPEDRSHPQSLSEMVSELEEMGDADIQVAGQSVSRILEFAARLVIHPTMPEAALRHWGQTQFPQFEKLTDQLKLIETTHESQSTVADPCLIFEVSSEQPPYKTRAFWVSDAHSYDPENSQTYDEVLCWDFEHDQETIADLPNCVLAELPDRLSGYFKTCVERDRLTDRLRLEVLLPLSLMDQPIELWSLNHNRYSPTIPASEFQVIVRCSERTTRPYRKDCLTKWQTHWNQVQMHLGQPSNPCLQVVSPLAKATQLNAHYQANSIVGFKLNDVPQRKFFEALLGAAAPVAVWLRQSPNQATDDDRSLLQWLEDFLQCSVGQLPHEALRVRAEAIAHSETPENCDFMIGHHLSLLWENPNLLPPLATKTISASL
jgi:vWA-MoxR associated protein C-terminal domain/Trypsin-like peptidase domain/vWA-MoxR associated protein middle region (VMAP-M) 1